MIRKPGFLNASRFRVSSPFHKPPSLFIPQHYRLAAYVAEIAHACAPGFQGGGAAHVQNAVDGKRAPVLPADIIRADGSVKGEICVYSISIFIMLPFVFISRLSAPLPLRRRAFFLFGTVPFLPEIIIRMNRMVFLRVKAGQFRIQQHRSPQNRVMLEPASQSVNRLFNLFLQQQLLRRVLFIFLFFLRFFLPNSLVDSQQFRLRVTTVRTEFAYLIDFSVAAFPSSPAGDRPSTFLCKNASFILKCYW